MGDRPEADEISLRDIMVSLPISKLWSVIAVCGGLLAGSFIFGFQLKSLVNDAKISGLEMQVANFQNEVRHYKGLEAKERFLSLYVRYFLAKEEYAEDDSDKNLAELNTARYALNKCVHDLVELSREAPVEEVEVRGLYLGKSSGKGEKPVIIFLFDGTKWFLPEELQVGALAR